MSKIKPMTHYLFEETLVGASRAILNKRKDGDVWRDRRILAIRNSMDVADEMWDLVDE